MKNWDIKTVIALAAFVGSVMVAIGGYMFVVSRLDKTAVTKMELRAVMAESELARREETQKFETGINKKFDKIIYFIRKAHNGQKGGWDSSR